MMGLTPTALLAKWGIAWMWLMLFGLVVGPSPGEAAVMAAIVAGVSWLVDRALPFRLQGLPRWAVESMVAGFTIYFAQFLWPGVGMPFFAAIVAGLGVAAIDLPLHYWLGKRFGAR